MKLSHNLNLESKSYCCALIIYKGLKGRWGPSSFHSLHQGAHLYSPDCNNPYLHPAIIISKGLKGRWGPSSFHSHRQGAHLYAPNYNNPYLYPAIIICSENTRQQNQNVGLKTINLGSFPADLYTEYTHHCS
jgi:hypothetical protein